MARIIDEKMAMEAPCHGYFYMDPETGEKKILVWAERGAIGPMRDEQEPVYCQEISSLKALTPGLARRFEIMRGLEEMPCLREDIRKEVVEILEEYKEIAPYYEVAELEENIKAILAIPKCKTYITWKTTIILVIKVIII